MLGRILNQDRPDSSRKVPFQKYARDNFWDNFRDYFRDLTESPPRWMCERPWLKGRDGRTNADSIHSGLGFWIRFRG